MPDIPVLCNTYMCDMLMNLMGIDLNTIEHINCTGKEPIKVYLKSRIIVL